MEVAWRGAGQHGVARWGGAGAGAGMGWGRVMWGGVGWGGVKRNSGGSGVDGVDGGRRAAEQDGARGQRYSHRRRCGGPRSTPRHPAYAGSWATLAPPHAKTTASETCGCVASRQGLVNGQWSVVGREASARSWPNLFAGHHARKCGPGRS